ncbi:hypothetical protein EON64_06845 [archaeon]|nr:MAG: hypothetical protein EON64_06845 [archaeon]
MTVWWRSTRVAFGDDKASSALVSSSFMNNMTNLNKYVVHGNPFIPNLPVEEVERESPCALTLPPSSTILSPHYTSLSSGRSVARLLRDIDVSEMPVTCAYDFWLFVEALCIFPSSPHMLLQHAQLMDTGFERAVSDWHPPLERLLSAEQLQGLLRGEGGTGQGGGWMPLMVLDDEATEIDRETRRLVSFLMHVDVIGLCLLAYSSLCVQRDLLTETHLQMNETLCRLHTDALQQEALWKELQQRAGEDEQARALSKNVEALKKKRSKR